MKIKINGDTWTLSIITVEEMIEKHGQLDGITDSEIRLIEFSQSAFSLQLVFHEILHAYIDYLHLNTSDITYDDTEEIFVEFFSNRGYDVYKQAKRVYNRLQKKLDKKVD